MQILLQFYYYVNNFMLFLQSTKSKDRSKLLIWEGVSEVAKNRSMRGLYMRLDAMCILLH